MIQTDKNTHQTTLLINCNLIDIRNGEIQSGRSLLIEQGLIQDIISGFSKELQLQPGLRIIDCRDGWLIPGLIDMHVHLCEEPDPALATNFRYDEQLEVALMRAQKNASVALRSGITVLRDMGSFEGRSLLARKMSFENTIQVSTIYACGQPITFPGGHWASHSIEAQGKEQLEQVVAQQINNGADFIKVMHEPAGFDLGELTAIVLKSHELGARVACHAYKKECVEDAINAGVDTIEHACQLNSRQIEQTILREITIVPTLVCAIKSISNPRLSLLSGDDIPFFEKWVDMQQNGLGILFDSEVLLGAGTDAGFPPIYFDDLISEIELFVDLGASNLRALQTATSIAAKGLGQENNRGDLRLGFSADIIVLTENPLKKIKALRHPLLVFKSGEIVVDNDYEMRPTIRLSEQK